MRGVQCLILAVITFFVWQTGASGQFVWIDHVEIEQADYRIQSWDDFKQIWMYSLDSYADRESGKMVAGGGYYRPVYAILISLDWWLWGANPFAFHLTNIVVHICVVLGLFLFGLQLFSEFENRNLISFSAALLFAVHPFDVHSVTWISGRKDTLCTVFALAALIGFGRLVQVREKSAFWKVTLIVACSTLCLNAAILCKELAIVVPAFVTVWLWYAFQHRPGKSAFVLLGFFWLSSLAAILFRKLVLGGIGLGTNYPSESIWTNLGISAKLICYYVVRIVIPIEPTLVDRWPTSQTIGAVEIVSILLVTALITWTAIAVLRRWQSGLLLSWFAIWLLPATGIVPLRHMYAERYLYPASWGLIVFVLYFSIPWIERMYRKPAGILFALCVAVFLTMQSITINEVWHSDETLFKHSVKQNEEYVEGLAALALIELDRGEDQLAWEYSKRAIESANNPDFKSYWSEVGTYTNGGLAALRLKQLSDARSYFEEALERRPNLAFTHHHLGLVCTAEGNSTQAMSHYQTALTLKPNYHPSRVNLGHIMLLNQEFDKCIELLIPTTTHEPENYLAQVNIATAYLFKKEFASAEEHFEHAIKLNPNDAINLAKLAWAEFESGKLVEGKIHIDQAKQLLPAHPTVEFVNQKFKSN